jgi:hypothetical protein
LCKRSMITLLLPGGPPKVRSQRFSDRGKKWVCSSKTRKELLVSTMLMRWNI